MRLKTILIGLAVFGATAQAGTSVRQSQPQRSPATYADIHARQALGRVAVPTDGKFFLYEWGRPYLNWIPDTKWMAPSAARRLQTFVYKVDLTALDPTSAYLFYPNAGCTYWLSDLSPDNKNVLIYELDHDDRRVRVGVWSFEKQKMLWFAAAVDEAEIETRTAWVSNDEFVYPSRESKSMLMQASLSSAASRPCESCTLDAVRSARAAIDESQNQVYRVAARIEASDVPKGAHLLTGAANGSLAIFSEDDDEVLALFYKQPEQPAQMLFENRRKWKPAASTTN